MAQKQAAPKTGGAQAGLAITPPRPRAGASAAQASVWPHPAREKSYSWWSGLRAWRRWSFGAKRLGNSLSCTIWRFFLLGTATRAGLLRLSEERCPEHASSLEPRADACAHSIPRRTSETRISRALETHTYRYTHECPWQARSREQKDARTHAASAYVCVCVRARREEIATRASRGRCGCA